MGKIIHMLSKNRVKKRCDLLPTRLITEENKGEGFHVHLRNMRLDFSQDEFRSLSEHLARSFQAYQSGSGVLMDDGRDGRRDGYYVLDEQKIAPAPEINPTKLQIEVNHPGKVHLHLRNLRLELSYTEFVHFARVVASGLQELEKYRKRSGLLGIFKRLR
jgi:hypothetical protein